MLIMGHYDQSSSYHLFQGKYTTHTVPSIRVSDRQVCSALTRDNLALGPAISPLYTRLGRVIQVTVRDLFYALCKAIVSSCLSQLSSAFHNIKEMLTFLALIAFTFSNTPGQASLLRIVLTRTCVHSLYCLQLQAPPLRAPLCPRIAGNLLGSTCLLSNN